MSKYAVIAFSVNQSNKVPRHWKNTKEEAIEHAGQIIANYSYGQPSIKLVVVEAVAVVERKADYNVRAPQDWEF